MTPAPLLPDAADRVRVRTSPASLAVEASAGTGKTYLLVVRALWLILVRRVPADSLVALAFGEEAAAELRQRLRTKLGAIVAAPSRDALDDEIIEMAPTEPLAALKARATGALEAFDRAHVSTIHAFASTVIRLYPAEAGVDPGFDVIDDAGFAEAVEDEWSRFVADELGESARRREAWLALLDRVRLADLFDLGAALADYETDLTALPSASTLSAATREWLRGTAGEADELLAEIPEGRRKAATALAGLSAALRETADKGQEVLTVRHAEIAAAAALATGAFPPGLPVRHRHLVRSVTSAARALSAVPDESLVFAAVDLLLPFARRARGRLLREGQVPYSGLLALARDLVRDHPEVRRQLNRRFRAILLDEAQDVDPMQLELVLFLAEEPGGEARDWREVRLEPGKLFVVGDPKQAIYGFRGADTRAFHAALALMTAQGAESIAPITSMRSDQRVLDGVNAMGSAFFAGYRALAQRPDRAPAGAALEVLRVEPAEGEDPEAVEAEAVAARIVELTKAGVEPSGIAVLLRKRSAMPAFAAALRARGLEASIERERRFFLRQEVLDVVNVLRLLADPADEVALAGVLRGPYGGLTDAEVEERFRGFDPAGLFGGAFARLRRELFALPAAEWVERLYQALGAEAVAACTDLGGRDAVRALRRLLAEALVSHGIPRTLELLEASLRAEADIRNLGAPPLEPPTLPAVEASGGVRLMTVHNAKGLEFPAVLVAGIDATPQKATVTDTKVLRDWAGGTHGITLRAIGAREAAATLDGCRLKALRDEEDRDETGRLVYVALTRARDTLIVVDRRPRDGRRAASQTSNTFRPFLAPLVEFPNSPAALRVSKVRVPLARGATVPGEPAGDPAGLRPALDAVSDLVTPSDLDERARRDDDSGGFLPAGTRSARAWLGELCHEVLRGWDFRTVAADVGVTLPGAFDRAQAGLGGRRDVPPALRQEALDLLGSFLRSGTAAMLGRADILGREVPLVAHVEGRTLSARADIVYAADGALRIGDFKLSAAALPSAEVARTYAALGQAAFGAPCKFDVLPLAGGNAPADDTLEG